MKYVRKVPGHIVGQTVDAAGQRAFCLTLQTREQHVRRDKANSNVSTNEGLLALRAAIYLAAMGPQGLREVAQLCHNKTAYLVAQLEARGVHRRFPERPFFNEVLVQLTRAGGRGDSPRRRRRHPGGIRGGPALPAIRRLPADRGDGAAHAGGDRPAGGRYSRTRAVMRRSARARLSDVCQRRYNDAMEVRLTAIYEQHDGWWVASVPEVPGVHTQGATRDEVRENLMDALALILEANRELAERELSGRDVIREELTVVAIAP